MNLVHLLRERAEAQPDLVALAQGRNERLTYAQLWERVGRVSAGCQRLGIRPGDRVILFIPMSFDLYAVLLGLLKLGATAVFCDPWVSRQQLDRIAGFAEARALIGVPKCRWLRWRVRSLRRLPIAVYTGRGLRRLEATEFDPEVAAVDPDTDALITFTGGSSGLPKGARRTHGLLVAQHRALVQAFPQETGDVDLPSFPVFALNNLAGGVPCVIPDMDFRNVAKLDPEPVLAQIRAFGVRTITASPPFFDRLLTGGSPPPLRRILTGGAPVRDDQLRAWRAAWPDTEILVVYGSTEAEPVAHLRLEERLARSGQGICCGPPVPGLTLRIDPLPGAGGIGELLVSGAHVGRDYFRNAEAVRDNKVIENGVLWHRMGDTGYLDEAGCFWFCGRRHSTLFRQGEARHQLLLQQAAGLRCAGVEVDGRILVVVESEPGVDVLARLAAADMACDELVVLGRPFPTDPRHNAKIDQGALRTLVEAQSRASTA